MQQFRLTTISNGRVRVRATPEPRALARAAVRRLRTDRPSRLRHVLIHTGLVVTAAVGLIALGTAGGCAFSSLGGGAQFEAQTQEWSYEEFVGRQITTDHYTIFSTLKDPELEQALPGYLEALFRRYEDTFPEPSPKQVKLTTYIFGTRAEWLRYVRRHFPRRSKVYERIRSGGFAEGDRSFSFYTSRSAVLSTLAHEGWHQYVGARFARPIPAWLNEGLACCHESVSHAGKKPAFTPRHNTFRINHLRDALQRDELLPLSQMVDTHAGKVIRQNHSLVTQTYYAQAWALVDFLQHGKGRGFRKGFERLLADLADGTFHTRISAHRLGLDEDRDTSFGELVFVQYFEATPDDLADEYYNHMVRLSGF